MEGPSRSIDHSSSSQEFTMNLFLNASMDTFPENTFSSLTTHLPTPIHLPGEWHVALVEIAWPDSFQTVTVGVYIISKRHIQSAIDKRPRKHILQGGFPMTTPAAFRTQTLPPSYTVPIPHHVKPGCYTSVDGILEAITKNATGKKKVGEKRNSSSLSDIVPSLLTCKTDKVFSMLHVNICRNLEKDGVKFFTESNDLQNTLGTNVIIDCSEPPKAPKTIDADAPPNTTVKHVGKWQVNLNAGCHTMFLYRHLVQNQTLRDKQTAILRSVPLTSLTMAQTLGEMNHKRKFY